MLTSFYEDFHVCLDLMDPRGVLRGGYAVFLVFPPFLTLLPPGSMATSDIGNSIEQNDRPFLTVIVQEIILAVLLNESLGFVWRSASQAGHLIRSGRIPVS